MRTTIDLPDALFRQVKATAANRGLKLKDFVSAALRAALGSADSAVDDELSLLELHRRKMRSHFRRMDKGRNTHAPLEQLDRDSLHERHA
ncbi:MAG: hypothetical protein ACO34E_04500 [Limisphaerales bacterium]|jgi:hypothetical protein